MQLGIGPAAAMHAAENLYLQGYLLDPFFFLIFFLVFLHAAENLYLQVYLSLYFRHNKQGYPPLFLRHNKTGYFFLQQIYCSSKTNNTTRFSFIKHVALANE